ncbi:MAG: aminotransferase class V-fold PLP-dependent enzyme, partial [Candidatus Kariarchaeaceae archaeon]
MNRKDFPAYPVDGSYLDSATLNLLPRKSIESMTSFDMNLGSTPRKVLYGRSRKTTEIYLDAKEKIVTKFGSNTHNFAFTPSLDYCWNQIIRSIIDFHDIRNTKIKVITTYFEHNSLLAPLQYLSTTGKIELLLFSEFEKNGSMVEQIDTNTIVALNHISPILGKYRDIRSISAIVRSQGGLLIIDYSRSAGQTEIDIAISDIAIIDPSMDLLSPQGATILYMNDKVLSKFQNALLGSGSIKYVSSKQIEQLSTIDRFETGNVNMRAISGLHQSLTDIIPISQSLINAREKLHTYIRKIIDDEEIVNCVNYDDGLGATNGNILTISMENMPIHDTVLMLEEIGKIEV